MLSETFMALTLKGCADGSFSETALLLGWLPWTGEHHRVAARHGLQLAVVARAVGAGGLADELGEPGRERAEARTTHGEADVGHAHVTTTQQGLRSLDAP